MATGGDGKSSPKPRVIFHDMQKSCFNLSAVKCEYECLNGMQQSQGDFIGIVLAGETDVNNCLLKKSIIRFMSPRDSVLINVKQLCKDKPLDFEMIYVDCSGSIIGRSFICHLEKYSANGKSESKHTVPLEVYESLLLEITRLLERKHKLSKEFVAAENIDCSLKGTSRSNVQSVQNGQNEVQYHKNKLKELESAKKDIYIYVAALKSDKSDREADVSNLKMKISEIKDLRRELEKSLQAEDIIVLENYFDCEEKCEVMQKAIQMVSREIKIQEIIQFQLQSMIKSLTNKEKVLKGELDLQRREEYQR